MSNLNLNTISSLDTGREVDVNRVMQTVDYVGGLVIDSLDTVIVDGDDRYVLAVSTVLPYTTTGAGMPEGGSFVSVGDAVLRSDLAAAGGASLVGNSGIVFDSVADMQAATWLKTGDKVRTIGYYAPGDGGGNVYEIVAAGTGTDDGGSFIDLSGSGLQASSLEKTFVDISTLGDGDNPLTRAVSSGAKIITNRSSKSVAQTETLVLSGVCIDFGGGSISFSSGLDHSIIVNGSNTEINKCNIKGPGEGDAGIGVYINGVERLNNIKISSVSISDFPLNGMFVDNIEDSVFSDLAFYNNQFSGLSDFTGNFRIDNSAEVIIDGVLLDSFHGKGVAFAFSQRCVLSNLIARVAHGGNSMAFYITGGSNRIAVSSFSMDTSLNEGFKISRGSYYNSVSNGIATGMSRGFQIQGSSNNTVTGLFVRNTGGGYAVRINSHDAVNKGANNNVISGCVIEKDLGTTPCILIDPAILISEKNSIIGCDIKSNTVGVRVEGLSRGLLISSCRIDTVGNCVYSVSGSENLVVDSCVLTRASGAEVVTLSATGDTLRGCKIVHKGGSLCAAVTSSGVSARIVGNEMYTDGSNSVNVHPSAVDFVATFNTTNATISDASGGVVSNNVSI